MLIRSISIGASTVAVASSFFFAYMQNLPAVASKPSYKPGFSRTFIEMMPEGSSESYRVHVRI